MSGKLTRAVYQKLIAEDIFWLEQKPRTLERDHIISVMRESERYYYDEAQDEAIRAARERALRPLEQYEKEFLYDETDDHEEAIANTDLILKSRREANQP